MVRTQTDSITEVLRECFASDKSLLSKWHVNAGQGIEKCVERTESDMRGASVKVFKITDGDNLVGYFGKEDAHQVHFLTGFFVKPEYRTSQSIAKFWDLIQDEFKDSFYCGLYEKNEPAIKFIKKNKGNLIASVPTNGEVAKFFKIEAGESCQ